MDYLIVVAVIILAVLWFFRSSSKSPSEDSRATLPVAEPERRDDNAASIVDSLDNKVAIRKSFRSVFTVMDERRRQTLVEFYMSKHRCTPSEAMEIAVLDWRSDDERFR